MTTRTSSRISTLVLLPGWQDSGPAHWQTLWPQQQAARARWLRVEQDNWQWPRRGDWMMQLDEALLAHAAQDVEPVVLVAHSLGCHLVAAWAAHSQHTARVRGAWLVAPPDLDGADRLAQLPPQLHGWIQVPRQRLPFAAQLLASSNDPYSSVDRARELAGHWGAAFDTLGPLGHVNAESGQGDWPEGWARLHAWLHTLT